MDNSMDLDVTDPLAQGWVGRREGKIPTKATGRLRFGVLVQPHIPVLPNSFLFFFLTIPILEETLGDE